MKIKQLTPNSWQLVRMGAFNNYFFAETDGLTVIDTNLSGSAQGIVQAAEQLGQPIRRIVVTHAHADHVASLDALAVLLPKAEIFVNGRTAQFLAGEMQLLPGEPTAKLRGGYVRSQVQPTALLADGDLVGSLQVVASPGHTPDHIAFFDQQGGVLFAGDAFQTRGGMAVAGTMRWRFPFPAMATWHPETAVISARRLATLNPQWLAVGHGAALENPVERMMAAIHEAEKPNGQAAHA